MLLMIGQEPDPKALISVVMIRVSEAAEDEVVRSPGSGSAPSGSKPRMPATTSGTVAATAVTVRTPAQK